jgi:membrane protein required for colicin V production
MNTLDLSVVAIVALSGLFAFVRGFVREVLAIAAWIGAAVAAVYFYAPATPLFARFITNPTLAQVIAGITIFVVCLLALSIVVGVIASKVRGSVLSPADRTLGLAFGVARGILTLCLVYLLMEKAVDPHTWPAWATDAKSRPLLAYGADEIAAMVPASVWEKAGLSADQAKRKADAASQLLKAQGEASDALHDLEQPPPTAKPSDKAHPPGEDDKKKLDNLFQSSTDGQ